MSTARITIGGADVSPHPSGASTQMLHAVEGQSVAGLARVPSRSGEGRPSVSVTVERAHWSTCPLPAGPWRIVGAIALGGLALALIAYLVQRRGRRS